MKKIKNQALMLFLSLGIIFTSCNKKEEIIPEKTSNNEGTMRLQAVTVAYTIKPSESTVDGSKLNLPPGSVVVIESGTRGPLYLKNFKGEAGKPITFINGSSGPAIIKGSGWWALKVGFSQNIRFTGTGSNDQYGIVVDGGENSFTLPEFSTNFEIDHIEVKNSGFAGIMAKTDPNCDSKTWRNNFTMKSISIHDNYVHDVKGEGFYIGNSFYAGKSESCGTVYPHTIEGLRVYKNKVRNTGAEGIQVGCAVSDCEIYDNTIDNYGTSPFAAYQNNGLQIGAGTGGKCYNNIIKNGPGNGLIVMGIGGNTIYNNVIINSGAIGIFADERTEPKEGFSFINNTIVNTGSDGIKLYTEKLPYNNVLNNIIINAKSGKYINAASGVKVNNQNNYFSADITTAKFTNASGGDYTLSSGSPAINTGISASSYGVVKDLLGNSRPVNGVFDIGAYEFGGTNSTPTTPIVNPTPTPTPDNSSPTVPANPGIAVTGLTLVNADTDKDILTLTNGASINLATIGTSRLNIRANATGTASVVFYLNGKAFRTESSQPFALAGDASGNYNVWSPAIGNYTVAVTPYTQAGGKGTKGTTLTTSFSIVKSVTSTPTITPTPSPSPNPGTTVSKFLPSDDVFIGSGVPYNRNPIRVEYGKRKIYLKFNVANVAFFNSAKLRLKCEGDAGMGNVKIAKGSHNNWTEKTITNSSAPMVANPITAINKTYSIGSTYDFDISSAVKANGTYTFVITMDAGGNDAGFSSKEGSFAPQLIINQ